MSICEEISYEPQPANGMLFADDTMSGNETQEEDDAAIAYEEEQKRKEEEERKKKAAEEEKKRKDEEAKKKKENWKKKVKGIGDLFMGFIQEATSEDENDDINNEDE